MKKYCAAFLCLALAGCVQPVPAEDPPKETESDMSIRDSMNIILSHEYGNFMVKWTSPVNGDPVFDIEVLAEDPDYIPVCPVKIRTYAPYANALDLIGYYVQENNYSGNLCFRITAWLNDEMILQENSELFASTDVIPEKKELQFGTDLSTADIFSFSYGGTGDSVELIFSYSVNVDDDKIIYTADFHDSNGKEHNIEKTISSHDWKTLQEEIAKGSLHLKHFKDPDLVILDGSETWFTILFADMDPIRERVYEFVPADREKLISILQKLAE